MGKYLAPRAAIMHSPLFEAAVIKVLAGKAASLTAEEAEELKPFRVENEAPGSSAEVTAAAKEGFADRILKRRKTATEPTTGCRRRGGLRRRVVGHGGALTAPCLHYSVGIRIHNAHVEMAAEQLYI
ncbi:hypothetical protein PF003_g13561 [Phytophthora fragariae]|nr:hypothetical protein PF003_g13561 [Phytophthora fragariae]